MSDQEIGFVPFVKAETKMPEFTTKAVVLGCVLGIVFGVATVYLALTAGLTVSASIPIAVVAIAIFKKIGRSTILENNIVQTVGSAGESVAAGTVFCIPALLFMVNGQDYFTYFNILIFSTVGGVLGVLFMIPLRRSLIVKEHGTLLYPEGKACAEVLIAGEEGGSMAEKVFKGLGLAAIYKTLMSILGFWKDTPTFRATANSAFPNASIGINVVPEYLGVGYIIGPKVAGILFGGGVLSYLVIIPLISHFGSNFVVDTKTISAMSIDEIRSNFVRYIGAGAVAGAGLVTLIRTFPTIIAAIRESRRMIGFLNDQEAVRTEKDIPIFVVIIGSLLLLIIMIFIPSMPGNAWSRAFTGLLIIIFGFLFVTVSSRITGLIGQSSNPVSGMTIATLMATCLIFISIGWTDDTYQSVALCVGSIVCMAIANSGATSQDLKTGFLVGATPVYQQLGLVAGVLSSSIVIGATLLLLDQSMNFKGIEHAIGTDAFPAPQAVLMATVIKGLLSQNLPWALVLTGFSIAGVLELCGIKSLPFAVGVYLPISTTTPIFVGGMIKSLVMKIKRNEETEVSSGMLYSTGLVAGGTLMGVLVSILGGIPYDAGQKSLLQSIQDFIGINGLECAGHWADWIGILFFSLMCIMLLIMARKVMNHKPHNS